MSVKSTLATLRERRNTKSKRKAMKSVIEQKGRLVPQSTGEEQWKLKIHAMSRKDELREERKLWMKNHRTAHLPRISPCGTRSHHPKNSEGTGPRHPGGTDEDHRLHRVNPILMMHRSKGQAIGLHPGAVVPTLHLLLSFTRCGLEMKEIAKNFRRGDRSRCLIAMRCLRLGVKNELNVTPDIQGRGVMKGSMTCREAAEVILKQTKIIRGAEFGTKSLGEFDIEMTVRTTIISEVARKTTELTTFTECAIVNPSEATTITEAGPKSPEAASPHEENLKQMTSIFGEGTIEMTIIYAPVIGR